MAAFGLMQLASTFRVLLAATFEQANISLYISKFRVDLTTINEVTGASLQDNE